MAELVIPTVEDAARIAQLINERAVALGGAWVESAAGVARWFALPVLDPAQDMRLVVTPREPRATRTSAAPRTRRPRPGST